jgi:hypothetical protein
MFVAAAVVLATLVIAYPTTALVGGWKKRRQKPVSSLTAAATLKLTEEFREPVWWFGCGSLVMVRVLLLVVVESFARCDSAVQLEFGMISNGEVLSNWLPMYMLPIQAIILFVYFVGVVAMRPFKDMLKNVGFGLVLLASLLSTVALILYELQETAVADIIAYAQIVLVFIFLGFIAALFFYGCGGMRIVRILRVHKIFGKRASTATDAEIADALARAEGAQALIADVSSYVRVQHRAKCLTGRLCVGWHRRTRCTASSSAARKSIAHRVSTSAC